MCKPLLYYLRKLFSDCITRFISHSKNVGRSWINNVIHPVQLNEWYEISDKCVETDLSILFGCFVYKFQTEVHIIIWKRSRWIAVSRVKNMYIYKSWKLFWYDRLCCNHHWRKQIQYTSVSLHSSRVFEHNTTQHNTLHLWRFVFRVTVRSETRFFHSFCRHTMNKKKYSFQTLFIQTCEYIKFQSANVDWNSKEPWLNIAHIRKWIVLMTLRGGNEQYWADKTAVICCARTSCWKRVKLKVLFKVWNGLIESVERLLMRIASRIFRRWNYGFKHLVTQASHFWWFWVIVWTLGYRILTGHLWLIFLSFDFFCPVDCLQKPVRTEN